ncbi:cupin domain-containing protein [Williamsia sterculiae]|uniref:Cupin domain-containing protein n=1 Tax=Williamsia sterculiae TaxID=1344003 RepID=A0A1N7F6B8_9NOCA|nr:cupin domain-containing protein [Williamsia sterculiae]SIR95908.1 Cupin domain-containing protein [Williamsia sterculiae]
MSEFIPQTDNNRQVFDVFAEIRDLPDESDAMLTDVYFSDFPEASSRIFRIYQTLPLHYHEDCDEHLYVVSGEGLFHLDGKELQAKPGDFLRFARRQVHGFPRIDVHPFVVLAIDVPRRRPDDITFINPDEGNAQKFMARNN